MDNIPLERPNENTKSNTSSSGGGGSDHDEAVSQLIQKFDGLEAGDDVESDTFQDNDDRAYDAIFGGRQDFIDHRSLHSDQTKKRSNLSSDQSHNIGAEGSKVSLAKLQESLTKLRRNKTILFAILVIITITCVSTIISRNKELNDEEDEINAWWNKKKFHGNKKDDDLMIDDALGNGVGFDSFRSDDEEAEQDQNYDSLFGQHDEGEKIYSTSSGGFTYYNGDQEINDEDTEDDLKGEPTDNYTNGETTVRDFDGFLVPGLGDSEESGTISTDFDVDPDDESQAIISNGIDMNVLESRFGDVDDPYSGTVVEVPFLFFIPRTGAALQEEILLKCHGLVAASGRGGLLGSINKEESHLEVVTTLDDEKYVNVDLRSKEGIDRAIQLDLIGSNLADLVVAQEMSLVSEIFHSPFKGKCFTLIRHPIERAVSVFYALKETPWDHSFKDEFADMTIEDYVFSKYLESNWLTRMLTNKMNGPIDINDFDNAKEFLSRKCLIGLTDEFDESHERFMRYFGWDVSYDAVCEDEVKLANEKDANQDRQRNLEKSKLSQKVYDQISDMNELDIRLYEYALELYEEQKDLQAFQ